MNEISFVKNYSGENYLTFPFYQAGKTVDGAFWGMTLRSAGSMKFRWNEKNENREKMLSKICSDFGGKKISQVQLDHTKLVFSVNDSSDTFEKIGDGIITKNPKLIPVVTVADCVPIFLYEPQTGFFGVVHSGWKGTGIVENAINLARQKYGCDAGKICVAIGPHIHDCCYIVNSERADYFVKNFSASCVRKVENDEVFKGVLKNWNYGSGPLYHLSLLEANLAVLKRAGIEEENIVVSTDCTCDLEMFGSNRRETSFGDTFTVQAAFTVRTGK